MNLNSKPTTNTLPPQVRYGQIKRKLGLDTWTPSKPKATATTTAAAEDLSLIHI